MMDHKTISKQLSYVLRHRPDSIGITLDSAGWVPVEQLLKALNDHGFAVDLPTLKAVVGGNDKQRFTLSPDNGRIRAAQGHSVPVQLELTSVEPPDVLYHGTAEKSLPAIRAQGLKPGTRQQVHLSADLGTARNVGTRHGKPHVLRVAAGDMHRAGHEFYQADNGVWLTDTVPAEYLADE